MAVTGDEHLQGLLGELERAVMQAVWDRGEASVRQVHQDLLPDRELAYTTVMTVMSRLADKGVLVREKRGRAYVYRPSQSSPAGFLRDQAHLRVQALLDQFGEYAVAAFLGELQDVDEERLAALKTLLAAGDNAESDGVER
jgi:predicted transcriptional regulator